MGSGFMGLGDLYSGGLGELRDLYFILKSRRFRVVGPKVIDEVLRIGVVDGFSDFPFSSGSSAPWRLSDGSFQVPPDSLKRFLYPPELELFRVEKGFRINIPRHNYPKTAFFGITPCDMASVLVMDRVQLGKDPYYTMARRKSLFVVQNCLKPGPTCFCSSTGSGPESKEGFDISYTIISPSEVLFRPGSEVGLDILTDLSLEPASQEAVRRYRKLINEASVKAVADFTGAEVPDVLETMLEPQVWKEVSEGCLGCANCNMVCPTCFCFDIIDKLSLDGSGRRVRIWDGCHSYSYAEVAGGNIRKDLWARYRHWVLHKFSYWVKQFGTLGCVGCGRCIAWCPAGIDLRVVVSKAIKGVRAK